MTRITRLFWLTLLCWAGGIVDEALQVMTPGRTGGDIGDWIADVLGAGAGAAASIPTQRRLHRRPSA